MSSARKGTKSGRATLSTLAVLLILPACSTLEPETAGQGFVPEESQLESEHKSESRPSESEKNQDSTEAPEPSDSTQTPTPEESSSESTSTEQSQESQPDRNCDKIAWSKNLREGEIVIPGDADGYSDQDGDGELEVELREVGMCKLHESGKKCGLVIFATKSCAICPSEFQEIGKQMDRIKAADMAVFVNFTETSLDDALSMVTSSDFLGSKHIQFFSNQDQLSLTIAPRKMLLDLRTMKVLALDLPLVRHYEIGSLVDVCNSI